jgi:hypothetical protein
MGTLPEIAPEAIASGSDDDSLVHEVCCDENRAWCGKDVSTDPWIDCVEPDEECVVCADFYDTPCPGCGEIR